MAIQDSVLNMIYVVVKEGTPSRETTSMLAVPSLDTT